MSSATVMGVCSVWPASRHGGSCAAGSVTSNSRTPKRSSCSRYSITSTRAESHGGRKLISLAISGSLVSGSTRRRAGYARGGSSSSTSRAVRGERLATGSGTAGWFNLSSQVTCLRGRTCQLCGASRTSLTCRPTLLEVDRAHGVRSAVAVRALPGAGRSLRSLTLPGRTDRDLRGCVGRLRSTFPRRGRRGRWEESPATRKVTLIVGSLLRRLPAALAGDGECAGTRPGSPAAGSWDGSPRCFTAPSRVHAACLPVRLAGCRREVRQAQGLDAMSWRSR